jgi:hypothetical protein
MSNEMQGQIVANAEGLDGIPMNVRQVFIPDFAVSRGHFCQLSNKATATFL